VKTIEILVRPNGETRVKTEGFSGSACREASRFLETSLGKRQSETLTTEFYSAAQNQNQSRQEE